MRFRKALIAFAVGGLAVLGFSAGSVIVAEPAEAHTVAPYERRICYFPGETTYQMLVRGCAVYLISASRGDVDPRTCYDRHPLQGTKRWGSSYRPAYITSTVAGYTPTRYVC